MYLRSGSVANLGEGRRRIALVHDWLVAVRGGERAFQQICEAFPDADIFTFIYDRNRMPSMFAKRGVRTSFIQKLPFSVHYRRLCLPLYPIAARHLDLSSYDVVIASSSAWAHGVKVGPQTKLLCYCYSPLRYIWGQYESLVRDRYPLPGAILDRLRALAQQWDRHSASRVDQYIAISKVVQQRIETYYGLPSVVVYPPVDLHLFKPLATPSAGYFLVVSALMKYKRVDVAVQAFNDLQLPLKVVGDGEEFASLKRQAGRTVEFLGRRSDSEIADLYSHCRAFVFTANEDFGITPLEAMASGRPVVAYGAGGALETVVDGVTGRFFDEQSPDSLAEAIRRGGFEAFEPEAIRRQAEAFGNSRFRERIRSEVEACVARGTTIS